MRLRSAAEAVPFFTTSCMADRSKSPAEVALAKQCLGQLGKADVDDRLALEFINAVNKSAQRTRTLLVNQKIQIPNVREFFETTFPNLKSTLEAAAIEE